MISGNEHRLVGILRKLEWSAKYSYCTGWPSCPICHGVKTGYGILDGQVLDSTGHREDCELKLLIEELKC